MLEIEVFWCRMEKRIVPDACYCCFTYAMLMVIAPDGRWWCTPALLDREGRLKWLSMYGPEEYRTHEG